MNRKSVIIQKKSHIRDKVKVVLDMSNCATKKELEHAVEQVLTKLT